MEFKLKKEGEYIKLGQLMKACNMVSSGSDAKDLIINGLVSVNGEICTMRGKKIYSGYVIKYKDKEVHVI